MKHIVNSQTKALTALGTVVVLLLLARMIWFVLFPPGIYNGARDMTPAIERGAQRWREHHVMNYHIVVQEREAYGLGAEEQSGAATYDLTIRDGWVVQSSCQHSYRSSNRCDWWHFWPTSYTVPGMFDQARNYTRHGLMFGKIEFDSVYGFPTLISNGIYDNLWQLEIKRFEVLP